MNYLLGLWKNKSIPPLVFGTVTGIVLCVLILIYHSGFFTMGDAASKIDEKVLSQRPTELKLQRDFWKEQIKKYGGEEAYRAFGEVAVSSKLDSHTLAHIFGEALYDVIGMEGVKICDGAFRFGCFHSFFGIAIYNEGIEILPELDSLCKEAFGDVDTRCQHGIGHGLLVYTGYENLLEALEFCATFQWQLTGSCTGGVFMEYNFHTMEEADGVSYSRDPKDGLYEPCVSLPVKFQPSCYHEQAQWWLDVFDNDFVYVGSLCKPLAVDRNSWEPCYQRVGNFTTEYIGADYDKIIEICSQMENEEASHLCREGATFPMTGIKESRETRLRLCEALTGDVQQRCVDSVDGYDF